MASRDLMNNLHLVPAIPPGAPVADTTPLVSDVIDTIGYEGVMFAVLTGDLADADASFGVLVEAGEAADLADAAPVPDSELTGTEALAGFTFGDDNAARKIGYVGRRRYVRLTVTPANNTANAFVAAIAVLGHPAWAPTPNPPG